MISMKQRGLRSLIAVSAATVALMVTSCADDVSAPPPDSGPDTTAPQPIGFLVLTYDAANSAIDFSWMAPSDDRAHERVDHYDIRYSSSFPFDWDRATSVNDPPIPLNP